MITDINGIYALKVEGENLIIYDNRSKNHIPNNTYLTIENEYIIPINEVCYMATNIGYHNQSAISQPWRLQLKGRKINPNVEMISENLLS